MSESRQSVEPDEMLDAVRHFQQGKLLMTLTGHIQQSDSPVIVTDSDTDEKAMRRLVDMQHSRLAKRKENEQALEAQRDNLEILNEVLRHDIRNELQILQAYARQLQTKVDEAAQADVERVLEAARNAVDVTTTAREMTDVLLQSGEASQTMQFAPVLESQVDAVRSNHDDVLVTLDSPLPTVRVRADEMLDSVFRNVLTNAINHNDKEVPELTVSATSDDGRLQIQIRDNGPGIPDGRKAEIFEKGEMGLDSEGTGLGLDLVDTLVGRYGGEIHVEDNDPDGTTFVIELLIVEED